MISLITRYLFIQFICNSFTTYSVSVKTYQVKRINESTYFVTSYPEIDNDNRKRFFEQKYATSSLDDLIPPIYDEATPKDDNTTLSTVTVGEKKEKVSPKITPEFIKKARDNYFRNFFATKKMKSTPSFQGDKYNGYPNTRWLVASTENNSLTAKLYQNLQVARKFASILINESQILLDEFKSREKYAPDESESQRRKRHKVKKYNDKHKSFWEERTQRYVSRKKLSLGRKQAT